MRVSIIIRFSFEGMHRWPGAPAEHYYLSYPHRHMFHVEATKRVDHNERAIEFIALRRDAFEWCQRAMPVTTPDGCSPWSCETLAEKLVYQFNLLSCRVLEDNENGALVEYDG